MAHQSPDHNPFMLLVHPEAVFAAVEKSERLGLLNRHLCRPLDRPAGGPAAGSPQSGESEADDEPLSGFAHTQ
ncbi:MAG: hypothetical protein JNL30_11195 [Rubrivivax sp.]|nr:hypothetical protein [Rubrivivax sp.]